MVEQAHDPQASRLLSGGSALIPRGRASWRGVGHLVARQRLLKDRRYPDDPLLPETNSRLRLGRQVASVVRSQRERMVRESRRRFNDLPAGPFPATSITRRLGLGG